MSTRFAIVSCALTNAFLTSPTFCLRAFLNPLSYHAGQDENFFLFFRDAKYLVDLDTLLCLL